jgi:sodium/potassium-transporting ATPase subunit alpha
VLYCTEGSEVDQAALTGESLPEARDNAPAAPGTEPVQSHNMLFFGTLLLSGNVTGIVHQTGDSTLLGKVRMEIDQYWEFSHY